MKVQIIPAIISKSVKDFRNKARKVNGIKLVQVDIMDGKFVNNKTLDVNKIPKLNGNFEAHLLVKEPWNYVDKLKNKFRLVIFHIEACKDVNYMIKLLRKNKFKVGIAISPKTKVEKIKPYLNKVDKVLIMTVYPGFYGRKFLLFTMNKVKKLRKWKKNLDIEVDGGINEKTINKAYKAGANMFISGSYIFHNSNPKKAIKELENFIR